MNAHNAGRRSSLNRLPGGIHSMKASINVFFSLLMLVVVNGEQVTVNNVRSSLLADSR